MTRRKTLTRETTKNTTALIKLCKVRSNLVTLGTNYAEVPQKIPKQLSKIKHNLWSNFFVSRWKEAHGLGSMSTFTGFCFRLTRFSLTPRQKILSLMMPSQPKAICFCFPKFFTFKLYTKASFFKWTKGNTTTKKEAGHMIASLDNRRVLIATMCFLKRYLEGGIGYPFPLPYPHHYHPRGVSRLQADLRWPLVWQIGRTWTGDNRKFCFVGSRFMEECK